jgi:hypothetical protein
MMFQLHCVNYHPGSSALTAHRSDMYVSYTDSTCDSQCRSIIRIYNSQFFFLFFSFSTDGWSYWLGGLYTSEVVPQNREQGGREG